MNFYTVDGLERVLVFTAEDVMKGELNSVSFKVFPIPNFFIFSQCKITSD